MYPQVTQRPVPCFRVVRTRVYAGRGRFCTEFDSRQLFNLALWPRDIRPPCWPTALTSIGASRTLLLELPQQVGVATGISRRTSWRCPLHMPSRRIAPSSQRSRRVTSTPPRGSPVASYADDRTKRQDERRRRTLAVDLTGWSCQHTDSRSCARPSLRGRSWSPSRRVPTRPRPK